VSKKPAGKKVYGWESSAGKVYDPATHQKVGPDWVVEVRLSDSLAFTATVPGVPAAETSGDSLRAVCAACEERLSGIGCWILLFDKLQ